MTLGDKLAQLKDRIAPGSKDHGIVHEATPATGGMHATPAMHTDSVSSLSTSTTSSTSSLATDREIHRTGAVGTAADTTTIAGANMVCVPGNVEAPVPVGERVFTVKEDHAVEKERVERYVEHRPVEREYVTKVEETGRVAEGNRYTEGHIVRDAAVAEHTCYPVGETVVEGVKANHVEGNRGPIGDVGNTAL